MLCSLVACVSPNAGVDSAETGVGDTSGTGDSESGDSDSDSARDSDTGGDSDSDSDSDSDTDSDTDSGQTPRIDGEMTVAGWYDGVELNWGCDHDTDPSDYWGYYTDSLGNLSGAFACSDGVRTLTVSFISPEPGSWTKGDGPLSLVWTDDKGHTLAWSGGDGTPTAWEAFLDTYKRVDSATMQLSGGYHAEWTLGDDAPSAVVSARWDILVPCPSCQ